MFPFSSPPPPAPPPPLFSSLELSPVLRTGLFQAFLLCTVGWIYSIVCNRLYFGKQSRNES